MSSIKRLIASTAVAAFIALPALATAQTPPTQPPAQPPATQQPTQPPATQPPATDPTQTPAAQTAQPDEQLARRYLTEARNTLSEMTQLPAAAQLTGETRTQVSQLISNFNELITTQAEWRASYAKVNANLTALIGPDPAATDPTTSGTAGAVGTTGTSATNLDPAIRAKLVELRQQLSKFEKAAGGTTAPTPAATDPNAPATPPTAAPPTNPPAAPPTTAPPSTPPATDPASAAAQGTTGAQAAGNAEVMRHIAAIEALLKTEDDSGGLTLTKAQLEQLRTHLALLRQGIEKK